MLQDGQTDSGSVNEVVRVGDTIRRPANRWTRSVHGLLHHLEEVGFDGAPRALGFDDLGREILSFIPGEPARRPWPAHLLDTDGVIALARYLAGYHEAVASFRPPDNAEWHLPDLAWKPGMIICHGDLGPWNSIWNGTRLAGLIDWDFAEPGSALTDVAQLAWRIVPLRGDDHWRKAGFTARPDMKRRLAVLAETYDADPKQILDAVLDGQTESARRIEHYGQQGLHPWSIFYSRGDHHDDRQEQRWLLSQIDSLI